MENQNTDSITDGTDTDQKNDVDVAVAGKDRAITAFVSRIPPQEGAEEATGEGGVRNIRVVEKIARIFEYYTKLAGKKDGEMDKNLQFTGTIIIEDHSQTSGFIKNQIAKVSKNLSFSLLEVKGDRVVMNRKEFSAMLDDFSDYMKACAPAIVFLSNMDVIFAKNGPGRENTIITGISAGITSFLASQRANSDRIITVVFTEDIAQLQARLVATADFLMHVDVPSKDDREFFLRYLFAPEKDTDFKAVAAEMEGWTWTDLERFAKKARVDNVMTGLETLSTGFLLDSIRGNNGLDPFTPQGMVDRDTRSGAQADSTTPRGSSTDEIITQPLGTAKVIEQSPFSEQLWQTAASCDYEPLAKALEHLASGTAGENDRAVLARYPVVLADDTETARLKLDAAKARIDALLTTFKVKPKS
jgi:hypothetical protein